VEVKPSKGLFRACVNDDSPMKLLTTSREYSWIVFLNATKDGGRVNWCVVAPYSYWDHERFSGIYKRLGLATDAAWKWGATLPSSPEAKEECLKDLVKFHKPHTYVRSNLLKLNVLKNIPTSEIAFWKHPDVALPLALKGFGGS
jgi:hypothetical protein